MYVRSEDALRSGPSSCAINCHFYHNEHGTVHPTTHHITSPNISLLISPIVHVLCFLMSIDLLIRQHTYGRIQPSADGTVEGLQGHQVVQHMSSCQHHDQHVVAFACLSCRRVVIVHIVVLMEVVTQRRPEQYLFTRYNMCSLTIPRG